jgi:hypothetical protein
VELGRIDHVPPFEKILFTLAPGPLEDHADRLVRKRRGASGPSAPARIQKAAMRARERAQRRTRAISMQDDDGAGNWESPQEAGTAEKAQEGSGATWSGLVECHTGSSRIPTFASCPWRFPRTRHEMNLDVEGGPLSLVTGEEDWSCDHSWCALGIASVVVAAKDDPSPYDVRKRRTAMPQY